MRISLEPAASRRGFVAVDISGERRLIPAPGALPLLARLEDPAPTLRLDSAEGRIEPLPLLDRLIAGLRLRLGAWTGAELRYPGLTLYPDGSRAASRCAISTMARSALP